MCTIIEHASSILWTAFLWIGFWVAAVKTSVFLTNRSPTSALPGDITPYVFWSLGFWGVVRRLMSLTSYALRLTGILSPLPTVSLLVIPRLRIYMNWGMYIRLVLFGNGMWYFGSMRWAIHHSQSRLSRMVCPFMLGCWEACASFPSTFGGYSSIFDTFGDSSLDSPPE